MKLSEHLKNGIKIAKENGIEQGKRLVTVKNNSGKICQVCALGNILLSLKGIEEVEQISKDTDAYEILGTAFPLLRDRPNACFNKKREELKVPKEWMTTSNLIAIFNLNDSGVAPEKIADVLEECGY